jgi:hypothetical protein
MNKQMGVWYWRKDEQLALLNREKTEKTSRMRRAATGFSENQATLSDKVKQKQRTLICESNTWQFDIWGMGSLPKLSLWKRFLKHISKKPGPEVTTRDLISSCFFLSDLQSPEWLWLGSSLCVTQGFPPCSNLLISSGLVAQCPVMEMTGELAKLFRAKAFEGQKGEVPNDGV